MRNPALSSDETRATGAPAGRQGLAGGTLALYALLVFCWGTSWYAMKLQVGVVAPEVSIVWRFLLAAPVMMAWAAARGMRLRYPLADHARFALMGVLMFSSNFILAYYGAGLLTSGLVSVVFSLTSIINLILGAILLGQPIEGRVALAALMGASGVGLMFLPDLAAAQGASGVLAGLAFSAAATLSFCLGNMVSARLQKRQIAVVPASAWGMFYGTAWAGLVAWLTGATFTVEWTARYLGSLVFLSLSATVLAFFAYLTLLGRIGAARAGYATVMFPVVALGVSTLFEGYVWSLPALVGLCLVLAGNLVVLTRPDRRPVD
ncbi:EamA family transporter [Chelatococcus composti]|jgi:drug/metabolite transporter (DMT)-like permease|nr:EamA family transporter [Chelatococcus composti]PZN46008.1 MAG: EamA family transporter [Pseudomonadota bacterium]